jgi:ATP-dependent Clp protease ATP-binding subunit ClpE
MDFYFQNDFLKINPYLRKVLKDLKDSFYILLWVISIYFIFFVNINSFKYLGLFLFIFLLTITLRRRYSLKDIRQSQEEIINLNDYVNKKNQEFLIEIITKAEILKIKNFELFFLKEIIKNFQVQNVFFRLGIDYKVFLKELENLDLNTQEENIDYYNFLTSILTSGFKLAKKLNYSNINILLIFYGLRDNASLNIDEIFMKFNLKKEFILSAILMEIYAEKIKFKNLNLQQNFSVFHRKVLNKSLLNTALTSKSTPFLDQYGLDLTYLATKGNIGFLIGHEEELQNLIRYLQNGENVMMIGDEGLGKETIIMHLAWLIANELVPKELLDYRVVKLDLGLLYGQNPDKFLEILSKILQEIQHSGYIILYIPYFENILLESKIDIMQILNEILFQKTIPLVVTLSNLGYQKSIIRYDLNKFFSKIEVKELSVEDAIYLLTLESLIWEKQEKIIFSPLSISTAVVLSKRFIKDKPLPKSAEEILIEAKNLVKSKRKNFINRELIQEIIVSKTKIPLTDIQKDEKEKLLNLENLLKQKIIGQDEAIKEIARVLKIYRSGLEKKKGPIGVFLFVGPTGVGKTETAKALAKIYYGSEKQMIRLDMVEFQNPEDIDKLIGNKEGTILGRLTEPILQNPFSLILLDEFEKTHPTILKIFLPIFDEGFIKDALGREVDFTNTLIICTSNAYSEFIKEAIENNMDFNLLKEQIKSKLSQIFSVELLNRFDNIVIYKPLNKESLIKICDLLIEDLKSELLLEHGISLEITDKAKEELVKLGTDPIFGARPLNRKINEILKSEIANFILADKIKRGNKILVDYKNNFEFIVI